jgi:hypothetical protein
MRIRLLLLACTLAAMPLSAQPNSGASNPADGFRVAAQTTLARPWLDGRLIVRDADEASLRRDSRLHADVVTRPRWRYPAIGAAVGAAGGILYAYAITRGDYVGLPVEPMYVLPAAYGLGGAFLGLLIDSADRERAARR